MRNRRENSRCENSRRARETDAQHRDRWLISYADLVTLLLALFVVLYAASDRERARQIAANFAGDATNAANGVLPGANALDDERRKIERVLASNSAIAKNAKISQNKNGLTVSLAEAGFFAAGEAAISREATDLIDALAESFKDSNALVRVEGHTDSTPISTERYPSNWELSTARASAVLMRLIERGVKPARLSAAGYGGEQPVADNATPEGRAANRRVDVVILNR